jgi:hypothetical protein
MHLLVVGSQPRLAQQAAVQEQAAPVMPHGGGTCALARPERGISASASPTRNPTAAIPIQRDFQNLMAVPLGSCPTAPECLPGRDGESSWEAPWRTLPSITRPALS